MNSSLLSVHYYPVKSLSFSTLDNAIIKKRVGILNDRIFSFSKNISKEKAYLVENFPRERKLNNFLTLKNTPVLNKYKFFYDNKTLSLYKDNEKIISILSNQHEQYELISNKLLELESSILKPIFFLKNEDYPFFDTTHSNNISNTISLININSIRDFEKITHENIEFERFRGNLYIDGLEAWKERGWINKILRINNVLFKVEKHIARCSATNLQPNTDNVTINLPITLKKYYNHIDMGIYLRPLNDGEINVGNKIILDE